MKALNVKTPYGILFAEASSDEAYPGICIYLRNNDSSEDALLTMVEYSDIKDEIRTIFYKDSIDEDLEPEVLGHVLDELFTKKEK